jgi:polar amino acid transport system substrate-binding protein
VTAALRRISCVIVTVGTAAVLLCGSAVSLPGSHGPSAHEAPRARLTAIVKAGTGSPTCDPTASLRPTGAPVVTPGSFMATIKARGYLIAGVDQNTYHFGFRNPLDGQIQGFDIDMLHAISAAIFGDPNKIKYVAMSNGQREGAIESGEVDIVAHTMTITCARLKVVDFSTVYFDAFQRLLVDRNSAVTSLAGLPRGSRVCTSISSTSIGYLRHDSRVRVVPVTYSTDCLMLLQEGRVDAISTDDAILAGLQAQDPETKIVGPPLEPNPYGLAISLKHPDFVRFVNGVLAQMRANGQWAASYQRWIGTPVPAPPPAQYRD